VAGHAVTVATLAADPRISLVFMRLPDGGVNGAGFERYGFQSMMQLWFGTHPSPGRPSITSMTTVDGSATYDFPGLVTTLNALIGEFGPSQIATQNLAGGFFQGDHQDHIATAYFVREAASTYAPSHRLRGFQGYPVSYEPENVSGPLLGAKSFAFYVYGAFDSDACDAEDHCSGTPYAEWLPRQYVTGEETRGVVADAGYAQNFEPAATVRLDGSGSSSEGGGPLEFHWTQVHGPIVALDSPDSAEPTFTAPSHPAVLRFSLTVTEGAVTSAPDKVTIRLPAVDPTPQAVVGPDQIVDSHATVHLDGGESWDPRSLPLEYAWLQTGGPPVELHGSDTATPHFNTPIGPALLTFELVVSNGEDASAPATVSVTVNGVEPRFRSADNAAFTAGTHASFDVVADGSPGPAITIVAGELPPGLTLHAHPGGATRISGVPRPTAPVGESSASTVQLRALNAFGDATQTLTLTVRTPFPPPPPALPISESRPPTLEIPATAYALTDRHFRVPLAVSGSPTPGIGLEGTVPSDVSVVGSGTGSPAIVGRRSTPGSWWISARATNEAGTTVRPLRLVVKKSFRLSRAVLRVPAGRRASRSVKVLDGFPPTVGCTSHEAPGVSCGAVGRRVVVDVAANAPPRRTTRLDVIVKSPVGTVTRSLKVRTQVARR
jgi:hypothetical protein